MTKNVKIKKGKFLQDKLSGDTFREWRKFLVLRNKVVKFSLSKFSKIPLCKELLLYTALNTKISKLS